MSVGLPPRAWGRPFTAAEMSRLIRFTPTCVGTTPSRPSSWRCGTVYPHVRGDDLILGHEKVDLARFTPTCVGTTTISLANSFTRPVYPHVRGDDVVPSPITSATSVYPHVRGDDGIESKNWAIAVGLPPRAWGRRDLSDHLYPFFRFTPTCVGTTHAYLLRRPCKRFTPTCVGTTPPARIEISSASVYPHVRGDDISSWVNSPGYCGLPPRAWGRQVHTNRNIPGRRFTPTCVGTTSPASSSRLMTSVYPHVRGDDSSSLFEKSSIPGLPPRAWGRRQKGRCNEHK